LNPLETGQSEAVIKISDDLWGNVDSSCRFYRTDAACTEAIEFGFEVSVNFVTPVATSAMPYNPFIFASPYWGRGENFAENPGRSLEIHLVDKPITDLADSGLFGLYDDTSNIASSRYYKTATNLPWALEVGTEWVHPLEKVDILVAYPLFKDWVESGGVNNTDWYLPVNSVSEKVFQ